VCRHYLRYPSFRDVCETWGFAIIRYCTGPEYSTRSARAELGQENADAGDIKLFEKEPGT